MRFIVLLAVLLTSQFALADGEAEMNYRQGVMKSVGGHMASMGAILRGRVHFDDFKSHAGAMKELATIVPHVFPEGSGGAKSEALPAIWEDKEGFKAAMDKFVEAANGISDAAESGEMGQIGPAIQALGQACKGCHDNYREES